MAFLLGTFGRNSSQTYSKRINEIAYQYNKRNFFKELSTYNNQDFFIALGYKNNKVSDKIFVLDQNSGYLLGKIFDRSNYQDLQLNSSLSEKIVNNPQILYDDFWGRYVGVFHKKSSHAITLVRDPLGLSTLFYCIKNDQIIFSTDLDMLYDVLHEKPAINKDYFINYIIGKNHALSLTPFCEIKELLPGIGLTFDLQNQIYQEYFWNISSIKCSYIKDKDEFQWQLLETLKSCIKAWTRDSSGICVELSGGIDSSSVLILLNEIIGTQKKLIAVNYIDSKIASSNEIEYAKEVANQCNTELNFIDSNNATLLDELPDNWRPNRPSSLFLFHNFSLQLDELLISQNCSDIINGQGGDHVFLCPAPIGSLADYWIEHGFKNFSAILNDISEQYRVPYLSLLKTTFTYVKNYYFGTNTTNNNNIDYLKIQNGSLEEYYLRNKLNKFVPAKAEHIESLAHAIAYCERNEKSISYNYIHPLLSQPIAELALKIPTYQSFENGYDRIFLRKAVSSIKNTSSLWRKIKGQTTSTMIKNCANETDKICDLIFNGALYNSGLIDSQWLEDNINRIRHGQIENLWPMLNIITSQIWLNQWGITSL